MESRNQYDVEFRDALGLFPTGVTVVTTLDRHGNRVGITANSFSSVSLDPMLVSWSISRVSRHFATFIEAEYFAIHVLNARQKALSRQFSADLHDRFKGIDTIEGWGGIPLLTDYCSRFECATEHRYQGGDHVILVGLVIDYQIKFSSPLVFHCGNYKELPGLPA